jgi:hypothetical protein
MANAKEAKLLEKEDTPLETEMESKSVSVNDYEIDTRMEDQDFQKETTQDKLAKENLKVNFGSYAERYHRTLSGKEFMPKDPKAVQKNGKRYDVFDPTYVPCPGPVKINETGGVNKGNLKPCHAKSPNDLKGKNLRDWWIVHHEKHWDVWYEMNKRTKENGGLHRSDMRTEAPPGSTFVEYPEWKLKSDNSHVANMSEYEKRIAVAREKYKEEQ